jgi:hypothetical protein
MTKTAFLGLAGVIAVLGVLPVTAFAGPCVKEYYWNGDGYSGYDLMVTMWNTNWEGWKTVETHIQYEWSVDGFHEPGGRNDNKYLGTARLNGAVFEGDRKTVTYRAFHIPPGYSVSGSFNVFWFTDGEYDNSTGQTSFSF